MHPIRTGASLDRAAFREIRREMELSHCKWDAQIGDLTAVADFPLLVSRRTWNDLADLAERLAAETLSVEKELLGRPNLLDVIALPRPLRGLLAGGTPSPAAVRVMRFDFHYTTDGWRVSEVNSDVPGGLTEATSFTKLVASCVKGAVPAGDPTRALVDALVDVVGDRGVVALTNAPGHMEDHQVVAYVARALRERGIVAHVVSPSQLRWHEGRARVETRAMTAHVDAVYRFYQAEWLAQLTTSIEWRPLFIGGRTPLANPGIAALSESKRLPLVWDSLATSLETWRHLLPETRALADAPWQRDDGWVIKSAFSNTGDTVSIRSAMSAKAWTWRALSARLRASQWVAQKRFTVVPVMHGGEALHPCIGVYTVDGRAAGAYARLASGPIVDAYARDAALLVDEDA
jgi:glutathionylspermidine synthase